MKKLFYILVVILALPFFSRGSAVQPGGGQQNSQIDSLQQVLKSAKEDTNKVNALNNLSWYYMDAANYNESILCAEKALTLAQKISYKRGLVNAYSYLGQNYLSKGEFSHALENYNLEMKQYESYINKNGHAKNLSNIGNVYSDKGDYPQAIGFYLKALKIYESIQHKEGIASTFSNIGIVYSYQNNLDKTLEFFLKALKINEELQRKKGIANCLGNIGNTYYFQHNYTKALEYQFKALKLNEKIENKSGLSDNYGNIGIIYNDQSDSDFITQGLQYSDRFRLSTHYSFKALQLNEELKSQYGIIVNLVNIGSAYLKQKKYDQAENYCARSFTMAKENGYLQLVKETAQKLSETYEKKQNDKKAIEYYKIYIAARDSLLNEENTKKTVRLEMNFEFDKKEAAAKLEQEKKEAIATAESKKQKIIIASVCGILLLVLVFAIFVYRSYLQKQKANIEITKQKHIIEEKQKEILDSIYYARRIQQALLPTEKYIEKNLKA